MTKPKKDSQHRRVILDLSWPAGAAVNEGVDGDWYWGRQAHVKLPTVQFMEDRLLELRPGSFMYKTDMARGYRQLRVDPAWVSTPGPDLLGYLPTIRPQDIRSVHAENV